jgi:hypothetical protein
VVYVPKGGMCATCTKKSLNCSHLEFDTMYKIQIDEDLGVTFVRCTDHQREVK